MESIFIDTSVIIDLLRGRKEAVELFRKIELGEVRGFVNKIVFLETINDSTWAKEFEKELRPY